MGHMAPSKPLAIEINESKEGTLFQVIVEHGIDILLLQELGFHWSHLSRTSVPRSISGVWACPGIRGGPTVVLMGQTWLGTGSDQSVWVKARKR